MYLINFSNQHAAGPKNIALNFFKFASRTDQLFIFLLPDLPEFRALKYQSNITVHFIKKRFGIFGAIFNAGFVNTFLIPKMLKHNQIEAVLAFGNFLSFSTKAKKIVLLHHPYLVDENLYQLLKPIPKLIEKLKRILFSKTVSNVDVVVVQSKYMQNCFEEKYPNEKHKTIIIANPLSAALSSIVKPDFQVEKVPHQQFKILYVSRFYPHKNHDFILKVSQRLQENNFEHEFLLTIDKNLPGADEFLDKAKEVGMLKNIGELPQKELINYYNEADLFFFPSKSETFGNPIIEAMFFSCPLLLPDLGYSRALAQSVAKFYDPDSANACADAIINIASNCELLQKLRVDSHQAGKLQLSVEDWFNLYYAELTRTK
jgi:glycosyltransferase involved in cell wall biosynthesis